MLRQQRINTAENKRYDCLKNSFNGVFILTSSVSKVLPATGLQAKRLRVVNCHENWTELHSLLPFWEYSWNFVFIPISCELAIVFSLVDLLMTTDKIFWMEETNNYSGTPLIRSPRGQKNFGRINEGFFYKKIYDGFC